MVRSMATAHVLRGRRSSSSETSAEADGEVRNVPRAWSRIGGMEYG